MNLVGLATVNFVLIRAPPSKVSVLLLLDYTIHHGQIERGKLTKTRHPQRDGLIPASQINLAPLFVLRN